MATIRFTPGMGMIRPASALQPLHLNTFISSVGAATSRRKQLDAIKAENILQQQFAELRARGFQARRDREAREQAERRAQWVAQQKADREEKQYRRKHADMWTTPKMVPLAMPPTLIRGAFLDTFLPSDLRIRKLFPDDPEKRARMKDLMGEYGALHDYTNWTGAMIGVPENEGGRKEFFRQLAECLADDTMTVFMDAQELFLQASEMGKFEYCFLTDDGKTDDLRRRLLEGGQNLRHESGLYSCTLAPSNEGGNHKIWRKYGDLVPTELERFNHRYSVKGDDTTKLQKLLTPVSDPEEVFKFWSPSIRALYAHLVPSSMEQFVAQYDLAPALVASRLEVATDAEIDSMPPDWHEKYGFLVPPSLARFRKRYDEKKIEYIRTWEYNNIVEEWDLEVQDAYPPFSDLERFERQQEVHNPETTIVGRGILTGMEVLKKKMLQAPNAVDFLAEYGDEVVQKYQHLIPTEAERFEYWHVASRLNGTKTLEHLPVEGSVWDPWSPAIKQAYAHLQQTDLELFEQGRIGEDGDLSKMELHLMRFGESAFEGHGEEVRRKWSWLCPTPEERFEYLFFDKDERGQLRPNGTSFRLLGHSFEGWSEHVKQKYARYFSSTW